ncbi:AAA family ATPase [Falsiruegeria litorea]|uniref:Ribose 1,5-bisphosphate phosphokinase PhnN n=1 Tax=Falsiruegeria litorea TaxID=1280831 RepID=A0ABS5WR95_9RHOB|nr:AAA family ATPase [Falsiruegeria litorea]MBT3141663.1 AAA family ATPase [Falsiruegeria litorea]MBT8170160.1 AAA family ATPase [Falsiruegeria litorea]
MSLAPVIAIVGPSGVGKDSVMAALTARDPNIQPARRVITRPEGEEGEDFVRATVSEFDAMQDRGEFVLSWSAHGLNYGIPVAISQQRQHARAVLVNLSRNVLKKAEDAFGDFIVISLTADPKVLADRVADRGRETPADQAKRLARFVTLPEGLTRVVEINNDGPLDLTVDAILAQLEPVRG